MGIGLAPVTELDQRILNDGLALAMEWGDDWLKPIQARLGREHPGLSVEDLDRYDKECRAAMTRGHHLVGKLAMQEGLQPSPEMFDRFCADARRRDPWISDDNLSHLYSQGCYYAMK